MSRSAIVPLYVTVTSEGNSARGLPVRRITATSPGATDSLNTTLPAATITDAARGYLAGEQAANTSTYNGNGSFRQVGFAMTPAQALASGYTTASTDGISFEAGNWVIPIHRIRPGGILTGDVAMTFNLNIYRVAAVNSSSALQHIGVTSGSFTVTTTETSSNATVAGAAAIFAPTDLLWFEIWVQSTASATSDVTQFATNSTTGLRISAAPVYTRQYGRSLADSAPAIDATSRLAAYNRNLSDAAPAADAVTRAATFRRATADTLPTPTDAVTRVYLANRQTADSVPAADALTRLATYNRRLTDSAPASDSVSRKATYARATQDVLSSGGGGTTIIRRPVYVFGN